MRARKTWLAYAVLLLGGLFGYALGCGGDLPIDTGGNGPPCFQDSDCVPDACCGQGTGVVSASSAPDCSGVSCDGSCPADKVSCGCGIPVCSDSQCTVAVTTGPNCPGQRGRGQSMY